MDLILGIATTKSSEDFSQENEVQVTNMEVEFTTVCN